MINIDCLTVLLMLKENKTRSAGNYANALILQLLGAQDAAMMKALPHTELSAALTGETSGGALAQIKQSNPPVASSRLVAVSAAAAVTALFVGNGAMRHGGLEMAFSSPILRMPDSSC